MPPLASTTAVQQRVLERRARSTVRRLLDGSGAMTIVAYRLPGQPTAAPLVHRWTGEELLVALPDAATEPWEASGDLVIEVRVDIQTSAPDFSWSVTTQSAHALGHANLRGDSADEGRHWASITLHQVFLHDPFGVTCIPDPCALREQCSFPHGAEVLAAQQAVSDLGPGFLADALASGDIRVTRPRPPLDHAAVGHAILLDIDASGLLIGSFATDRVISVHVPFERAVSSTAELTAALGSLTLQT